MDLSPKRKNLHLGCGKRKLPGFINIDSRSEVKPDLILDVQELDDKFSENTVASIYASHVLEHFSSDGGVRTLQMWHKILKPHCELYLAVPDFEKLCSLYKQGVSMWRIVGPLMGRHDYPQNIHHNAFDYEYLSWMMSRAGFYDIEHWDPHEFLPDDYDDLSLARIDGVYISLCLKGKAAP